MPSDTTFITLSRKVTNLFDTYSITADTDASLTDDTGDLSAGENVITITVTAADESTKSRSTQSPQPAGAGAFHW